MPDEFRQSIPDVQDDFEEDMKSLIRKHNIRNLVLIYQNSSDDTTGMGEVIDCPNGGLDVAFGMTIHLQRRIERLWEEADNRA